MARLFHFPLDPFCRRIRLSLCEYARDAALVEERPWEGRPEFLDRNPAGLLPIFEDDDGTSAVGIEAVGEYLDETRGPSLRSLYGSTAAERAEARRLVAWFDQKFHGEVSAPLIAEKVVRRHLPREAGGGPPEMAPVRQALAAIRAHLNYIGYLADSRNWLAGAELSAADLAAAAHLSAVDYLGDVPWEENADAKAWYQRIKSRPAFRPLLGDQIRGVSPPPAYADLDF
jgi:glutathione S-transferase